MIRVTISTRLATLCISTPLLTLSPVFITLPLPTRASIQTAFEPDLALLSEEELVDIDISQSAVDGLCSMVLPAMESDTKNRESNNDYRFSDVFGDADAEIAL